MLPLQRLHDPQSGGQARGIAAMARTSQGRHFRLAEQERPARQPDDFRRKS